MTTDDKTHPGCEIPPRGIADPNVDVQRIRILETRLRQMARAREVLLNNVIEEAARIAQQHELNGHTGAAQAILALKKNVASVPPEPEPGEAEAIVIGGARVHPQNQE